MFPYLLFLFILFQLCVLRSGLLVYFCYGIHHSRESEPLSSYTTLLPPGEGPPTTATMVTAMQSTISQVRGNRVLKYYIYFTKFSLLKIDK